MNEFGVCRLANGCTDQQYSMDGVCMDCGAGCASCADETGMCDQCFSGYTLSADGLSCESSTGECNYKVGPVNGEQTCYSTKYSDDRIIGPLADSDNVDWRLYNVVTPIRDQLSCGSCWAFAVTGMVESAHAIKHGPLYEVSDQ